MIDRFAWPHLSLSFPIYQFKELQGWKASRLLQINLQINIIITSNFYSSSVYLSIYLDENFKTMGEQAVYQGKRGANQRTFKKTSDKSKSQYHI